MNQNKQLQQLLKQITQELLNAGVDQQNIPLILKEIDTKTQSQISKDIVAKLNYEQKAKLDSADEKTLSNEEFGKLLDATPEDIASLYAQKLEEYLKNLPQNFHKIKSQFK